jgi:uncharacterized protein (DUF2267 family)
MLANVMSCGIYEFSIPAIHETIRLCPEAGGGGVFAGRAEEVSKVPVFDKTEQKTMHWVNGVAKNMGSRDFQRSYMVLRGVLHALRDRLPTYEAVQFGAQMPMLVRGFYYEGWRPQDKPKHYHHKDPFLQQVRSEVPVLDDAQIEKAVSSVFATLEDEIPGGELKQVRHALPSDLRDLWAIPG